MNVETAAVENTKTPPTSDNQQALGSLHIGSEQGVYCPICLLPTGRLIRNKVYCGNCGFIES